ncbi:MAG TPA: hypothetical protein VMR21_15100 [Vicinamibacteria bacterium]|nr:hypothetical protein [Vicinamibacteria bacterium]
MKWATGRRVGAVAAVGLTAAGVLAAAEPPVPHLESRRLRSAAVYLGTVTALRRLGSLDGLEAEMQGRMEATVALTRVLRAPSGAAGTTPAEVAVRFDSRAPAPEGEGFYTLAPGEAVLVFADGLEPAYPRQLLHGTPAGLAAEVKALRDFVAAMSPASMRLHGLTAATRLSQVRLYDAALSAIAQKRGAVRRTDGPGEAPTD